MEILKKNRKQFVCMDHAIGRKINNLKYINSNFNRICILNMIMKIVVWGPNLQPLVSKTIVHQLTTTHK